MNASCPDGDKVPRPALLITGSHVQPSAIASGEPGVCSGSSERPILDPQHCRARRVLHLDPAFRPTAAVGEVAALGYDALQSHPAGVFENQLTIIIKVFAEVDAVLRPAQDLGELGLARLKRSRAPVVAVQLDQVEGE